MRIAEASREREVVVILSLSYINTYSKSDTKTEIYRQKERANLLDMAYVHALPYAREYICPKLLPQLNLHTTTNKNGKKEGISVFNLLHFSRSLDFLV